MRIRLAGLVAACSLALVSSLAPARSAAQDSTAAAMRAAVAPQDLAPLAPGDLLRLVVWHEPEMSGEFLIDEQGNVTLPLLGARRAAGVPIAQLREGLVREFQAQLRNPSISIIPLRRINVLGEVNKPGVYPADLTVTVSQLVGMAGGVTPFGDLRRVSIVRSDGQVVQSRAAAGMALSEAGIRSGDQVLVGRRSWIERNSPTLIATAVSLVASAVTTLIIYNKR